MGWGDAMLDRAGKKVVRSLRTKGGPMADDKLIPAWINLGTVILLAALVVDFAVVFYNAINATH